MIRATAAEVQKQFGYYTEKAQREPVTVTKHGRDSVVLVSSETFERLKAAYHPTAYATDDLPENLADELLGAADAWLAENGAEPKG